jgi:hypothetical protein
VAQHLRADPRFRRLVDHLHRLGPRPTGELLIQLAAAHQIEGEILARLERFGEVDPVTLTAIEARDWLPMPLGEVVG